ncbi:fatty acid oxidation complex subunit alpha FadB [Permianibacter aggregans]|uniref:enoyl-CoA hydratase n=1 Tax=Permianibacter aggregans TaxID=1510150 RepID=A0A4R6UML7_9GAMM|nr:fatty acid oxidation complex subunit alpha FadB [Permianibacter aggregans]QGX40184.1 fatty acid oxidation complex subunit alpha FadB [Permianibacter aggregans]TDQ47436.1 short chain enoyl-CoA hydratase /3-hydroxyacyl-CoA dehydrogenase [Permianibacter aggregans]
MLFEGKSITCTMLEGGIVEFQFNLQNESVNKFNRDTLAEFNEATATLAKNKDVKGVVVTSGKDVFIVGADITEFLSLFAAGRDKLIEWTKQANAIFNGFEDLPVPTVCAINGIALGGGMEMALSCDYRIASTSAQVGLPEVKLGLIPGFGGTTRLPRLIGSDNALEWIATGNQYKAEDALKVGAVDAVAEPGKLKDAAIQMVKQAIEGKLNWQKRREQKKSALKLNKMESLMAFSTSKAFVAGKAGPHYPAPMEAVNVVEKAARLARDEALLIEHEGFANVALSDQASSLITIFLNDQLIKKGAKKAAKAAKPIHWAGVLGAGIMGGGIAYQAASRGTPMAMKDIKPEALDLGMSEASKILLKGVEIGKITNQQMAKTLASITPTLEYSTLKDCDIVVEAVVENPKVKDSVLCEMESVLGDKAILASNTSTISIDLLAKNLKRPENFCGMHFFNPVHKMPLVEVIRGKKTSEETIATVVAWASAMGKSPIVVNDCPGFLVNRVLFPYFHGFSLLLRDGADFTAVDKVMEKFGWPMGPAYLLDVVGLDTAVHAANVMAEGFPDRMKKEFKDAIEALYEQKRFGQKNGKGFYAYSQDKKGKPKKDADPVAFDIIKSTGVGSKEFDKQDIIDRMMIPMLIETVRCLEEKIVATPSEADMGLVYGIGFPPFRGGALKYLDTIGLDKFIARAEQFKDLGKLYEPTETMRDMAKKGQKYYSL